MMTMAVATATATEVLNREHGAACGREAGWPGVCCPWAGFRAANTGNDMTQQVEGDQAATIDDAPGYIGPLLLGVMLVAVVAI